MNRDNLPPFKKNDWCFSNFELCQIVEMEDGHISSVTTGSIRKSGWYLDDSCFPLDIRIKNISDTVHYYYKKLHELNRVNLNYPDIVRWLEAKWADLCRHKDDDKFIQKGYDEIQKFYRDIETSVSSIQEVQVNGISLIRR